MASPPEYVYVVLWCGELLELDAADAFAFSEAEAHAIVEQSPGRRASYDIERWPTGGLLAAPRFAAIADLVARSIESGDRSPIMLRDAAERARRGPPH